MLCQYCQQDTCDLTESCIISQVISNNSGDFLDPVPHISDGPCPDCSVMPGGFHHADCSIEICPECDDLLDSCNCGEDAESLIDSVDDDTCETSQEFLEESEDDLIMADVGDYSESEYEGYDESDDDYEME